MKLKSLLQLIRPEQWTKNLFIFLPLFFNGQLFNVSLLSACVVAFFAFSFAASSMYCFNDVLDIESDKQHPKKRSRPLASGSLSVKTGYGMMALCLILSLSTLYVFGNAQKYSLFVLIAFYYVMNVAYSLRLKHYAIVDVMIIAVGFVLRVVVGGAATNIWLSEWMIIMTFLLALFLAFAKRRDDVIRYHTTGVLHRKNTEHYTPEFMNQIITIIATITVMAYIMYTLSPEVTARFNNRYVYATSVFVLAGIIRYLQLTMVEKNSGSPTQIFLRDRFIQACMLGWGIAFGIIIYGRFFYGI